MKLCVLHDIASAAIKKGEAVNNNAAVLWLIYQVFAQLYNIESGAHKKIAPLSINGFVNGTETKEFTAAMDSIGLSFTVANNYLTIAPKKIE